MDRTLRQFYDNEQMRNSVKEFLISSLKDIAVEKTFSGENVDGIKDAKELIESAFRNLEVSYGKIKEPVISNSR